MTSSLLHAAVARVTGDALATVERLGFRLKRRARPEKSKDDPLAVIDCPCCGGTVVLAWNRKDDLPEDADCRRCETIFPYSPHEVYEIDLNDVSVPTPLPRVRAA